MATTAPSSERQHGDVEGGDGVVMSVAVCQKRKAAAKIILTGFGPFMGVENNPTQRLIERLNQDKAQVGGDGNNSRTITPLICQVLEVSAAGAKEAVDALHTQYCCNTSTATATASREEEGEKGEEGDTSSSSYVFVHMGVDLGAEGFKLECRAFNEADFRCPDQRAHQPRHAPILPTNPNRLHTLHTSIDLPNLAKELQAEGWKVDLSDDAGRYVCNFTYYHSLHHCLNKPDRCSLFLHVPPVEVISFEQQYQFVKRLLLKLAIMEHDYTRPPISGTATVKVDAGTGTSPPPPPMEPPPSSASFSLPSAAAQSIMELGFSREQAEAAIRAVGASNMEEAVNCEWDLTTMRFKLVLVVRQDLGMSTGKMAAQCCHAALAAYQTLIENGQQTVLAQWQAQGEPVIALKCSSLEELRTMEETTKALGLPANVVRDAGRTQVNPGSTTVLAIGPAPAALIDSITGSLRLL